MEIIIIVACLFGLALGSIAGLRRLHNKKEPLAIIVTSGMVICRFCDKDTGQQFVDIRVSGIGYHKPLRVPLERVHNVPHGKTIANGMRLIAELRTNEPEGSLEVIRIDLR